MAKITFQIQGGEDVCIFAARGENLLALARKANVAIDAPCSGNGSCGKCRVKLVSGELQSGQSRHMTDAEYEEGWRLACGSYVLDADAAVLVPDIASAYKSRIRTVDLSSPAEAAAFQRLPGELSGAGLRLGSDIVSLAVTMDEPTLFDTMPDNERLTRALQAASGTSEIDLPLHALPALPDALREGGFCVRCVAERHGDALRVLDVLPGNDTSPVCGVAADIGTTTVSALLVDLLSGDLLAGASAGNGQIRYGADVINRIVEQQKPGGRERLRDAIAKETLLPLMDRLCREAGVDKARVYRMSVASNTTMNHLLLGVNAEYLRTEPYVPAFFALAPLPASALELGLCPAARLYVSPNIGSYVGGDITAGVLASFLWKREALSMLIDLGTNGEIVLGNSEFLMACACSAGPAFEGGDIACGMRATDGAIDSCTIDKDTMEPVLSVIGGGKPVGLCGSGLIDAIAALYGAGLIDGKGKFVREGGRIRHDEYGIGSYALCTAEEAAAGREVYLCEVDIDNFIRAKGAIFSAIMTLLSSLGFTPSDIAHIDVAGGIGSSINIRNAMRIGMFPDLPEETYRYIGNSSLSGAYAMLLSDEAEQRLREIASGMTYLELSTQPGYMDAFIAACFLPHTDASLFPSSQQD